MFFPKQSVAVGTTPTNQMKSLLLVTAAITMGGISIWSMHYIGNRAMQIGDGDPQLQIAYSSGYTALSFFMPILVLLAAFVAIGTSEHVSWWRVGVGGSLAGAAICGMHYLGNASINNYECVYNAANVVGASLIAVAASILALLVFFVIRASWTNSWWKRAMSSVLLAGAVSGMHWCASTGTQYRLVALAGTGQLSRNTTVIVVICLVSISPTQPRCCRHTNPLNSRSELVSFWPALPCTLLVLCNVMPTRHNR